MNYIDLNEFPRLQKIGVIAGFACVETREQAVRLLELVADELEQLDAAIEKLRNEKSV